MKSLYKKFLIIILLCLYSITFSQVKTTILPGVHKNYTLLPNGWKLTPAGQQVPVGELPLNMLITKDGRYAITSNSGMGINSLSVVDVITKKEVQRIEIDNTWVGLAFGKKDNILYVSGGYNNKIYIYHFADGRLTANGSINLGQKFPKEKIAITGLAFFKKKNILLAVSQESNMLYIIDLNKKAILKTIKMSGKCYQVRINHSQTYAYVSIWGKASVAEINLKNFTVNHIFSTGDHPTEMAITHNDKRLFVANTNNNSVSVLDLKNKKISEKILTSLVPDAPLGSTPDALALTDRDKKLIVTNADNNYLAIFDISKTAYAKNIGFIPTGWYPTAVKYLSNQNLIVVANGKGIASRKNPNGPNPTKKKPKNWMENYTGTMLKGTISFIKMPNEKQLAKLSKKVYNNTPYTKKYTLADNVQKVIPKNYNNKESNKIKHIFYIIRENRSYDQVFGDLPKGNNDPSLCLFGKNITPNAHKLAEAYTTFDNFYVDAEVSADGHNWSTAAYATDYVEKLWPVNYGNRGAIYNFEGGTPIAAPSSGYIWNNVMLHHKTFRDYGEFVVLHKKGNMVATDADLASVICPKYPGFNLNISDSLRYKVWEKDFDRLLKINKVPALSLIRLPNDHCWGTREGKLTPQAYVAQNDYAMGLIVDKISHSKIWKESIIYILEDDAQNGPDHVDAHRSVLLAIGPYVKRNFVDHTMYTTSSVLKTIELILGLPPMTQFDLSANPIVNAITDNINMVPFNAIAPKIDIHKKNLKTAYGSNLSKKLNFNKEDAVPDGVYNTILWKAVKGKNAVVPAPVHSAFVIDN